MPLELSAREAGVLIARREAEKLKGRRVKPDDVFGLMKCYYRYRQLDIGTELGTDDLQLVERVLNRLIAEKRVAREWSSAHGEYLYRKLPRRRVA